MAAPLSGHIKEVVEGSVKVECPVNAKVVRIFTSSTFAGWSPCKNNNSNNNNYKSLYRAADSARVALSTLYKRQPLK